MPGEERGLLGDLPRERPGTRSARRGPLPAPESPRSEPPAPGRGVPAGDAATAPLSLAVGAAEAGLKIASRLTGELIRRLPRL